MSKDVEDFIKKIEDSFEKGIKNDGNMYGVNVTDISDFNYHTASFELISRGYSVMVLEENGEKVMTIYKKSELNEI